MKKKLAIISVSLLLILSCIGNLYLFRKAQSPTIYLHIGIPDFDNQGNITSIYYTAVDNRKDTDTILLAMINAGSADPSTVPQGQPDAMIMMRYQAMGYQYQLWFLEDAVILGTSPSYEVTYRMIHDDHTQVVTLLKDLVKNAEKDSFFPK